MGLEDPDMANLVCFALAFAFALGSRLLALALVLVLRDGMARSLR